MYARRRHTYFAMMGTCITLFVLAWGVVRIWSIPVAIVRDVPVMALLANGREDRVLRTTAVSAVCNTVLNVALIPQFGMIGAATATLVTEVVRLTTALVLGRATGYPLTSIARFWRAALAGGFMAVLLVVAPARELWIRIPLGAAAYAFSLALLGGIRFRRGAIPVLDV